MIDKVYFYKAIRDQKLFDKLTDLQVTTIDALINEMDKQGVVNMAQAAYLFATAYHECHNPKKPELRMTPMVEFGGQTYLKSKKYYPFFGRGLSQLTWDYNYKKEGKRLGLDLMNNPEQILEPLLAANSHVYCMMNGTYTTRKLPTYVNDTKVDFINARRVVNGTDAAEKIAIHAETFLKCLKVAA